MQKRSFFSVLFLELAFMFLITESFFRLLSFPEVFNSSFLRIELFSLSMALILAWICSLFPQAAGKLLVSIIGLFFSVYAITQLQFMNFYGSYMSVKAASDGMGRISEFVGQFINLIKPEYYLALVAPVIVCVLNIRCYFSTIRKVRHLILTIVCCIALEGMGIASLAADGLLRLYSNPTFIDRTIREVGLGRFLMLDLLADSGNEELIVSEQPEFIVSETPETDVQNEEVITRRSEIDDSSWVAMMQEETNDELSTIDRYLLGRRLYDYNDHTGMFQDFNVVYIMIEAFDYMAIDPVLTPTIYWMKEEGWDFTHHYTPKFSCATGESEFVSETSLVPLSEVCTPNSYAENHWANSIFNVFYQSGYYSSAYHNWQDEFYERRTLYSNSGCQAYYNFDDLDYKQIWGWQSDLEMMELTIPLWINEDRFFSLYVTSSTHFPYDQESELGNRYLDEINQVHPDYPMEVKRYLSKSIELDKSLEYLMDQLDQAGKLDNTLIVLFADHHPLETAIKTLADYGGQEADRLDGLNEDRTPMIFYTPSMTPEKLDRVNSTFDILPTVLNLVGIHFEPRIYVGTDYFDPSSKLVIFPNGSLITDDGAYYASSDEYDDTLDRTAVEQINTEVENLFLISRMIYRTNYFKFREWIPFP